MSTATMQNIAREGKFEVLENFLSERERNHSFLQHISLVCPENVVIHVQRQDAQSSAEVWTR